LRLVPRPSAIRFCFCHRSRFSISRSFLSLRTFLLANFSRTRHPSMNLKLTSILLLNRFVVVVAWLALKLLDEPVRARLSRSYGVKQAAAKSQPPGKLEHDRNIRNPARSGSVEEWYAVAGTLELVCCRIFRSERPGSTSTCDSIGRAGHVGVRGGRNWRPAYDGRHSHRGRKCNCPRRRDTSTEAQRGDRKRWTI
jgi:hypothetical protein